MKQKVTTIDLTPTPEGYVNELLLIISDSTKPEDRKWAKDELIKAMTIAYGKEVVKC